MLMSNNAIDTHQLNVIQMKWFGEHAKKQLFYAKLIIQRLLHCFAILNGGRDNNFLRLNRF